MGLRPENNCAGEDQQQTTDPSSRQRERSPHQQARNGLIVLKSWS
jgi:hypothetical protein